MMNPEELLTKFEDTFDYYSENANKDVTENVKLFVKQRLYELREAINEDIVEFTFIFTQKFFDDGLFAQVSYPEKNFVFFGDFHGSLSDFIHVRNMFWKDRTLFEDHHFVFLGDYVDRGIHGLEIAMYLLLMRLLYPKTFTVLRGNHDVKSVNESSFLLECQNKFGTEIGNFIWTEINICFAVLPYAALVNEENFCCHGGIPRPIKSLSRLGRLPKSVDNLYTKYSPLCNQILWNDFYSQQDYEGENIPKYYIFNKWRKTAFIVGEKAVEEFTQKHGIKRIFRAHQYTVVDLHGYEVAFGNKVFTLFSNSSYDRLSYGSKDARFNSTACAVLHPDKQIDIVSLVDEHKPIFSYSEDFETNELCDLKYTVC